MTTGIADAPDVVTRMRDGLASHRDKTALTFVKDFDQQDLSGASWTYGELDHAARQIAVWLRQRCAPGDRVLLLHPQGRYFAASLLGALYAGMIAVPSSLPGHVRYHQRRVTSIARSAGAAAVITESAVTDDVREWASTERQQHLPLLVADEPGFADAADWTPPELTSGTLAVIQYTSGSTGDPKGVMVTHGNLLHNAVALCGSFGLDENTTFGSWIPNYHDMGLMGLQLPSLLSGASCVLMSPTAFLKRPHHWLRMIDAYGVHYSPAPDFGFELCTRMVTDAQLDGIDLSRWAVAMSGSEPVRAATFHDFAERFARCGLRAGVCVPGYGLAEATAFVAGTGSRDLVVTHVDADLLAKDEFRVTDPALPGRDLTSNGPADLFDVRIVHPVSGETRAPGEIGEVWLRGPSVAQGYWDRPEATEETFNATTASGESGFLRTGDLGVVHHNEIYVTGRLKDIVIQHGKNLYPQDIEHQVRDAHPELAGLLGAVFTVPFATAADNEENLLVITHEIRRRPSDEDCAALVSSIKNTVSREFGATVSGVALTRRGAVSRTTSGKVQRRAVRELLLSGELAVLHLTADRKLQRCLEQHTGGQPETAADAVTKDSAHA